VKAKLKLETLSSGIMSIFIAKPNPKFEQIKKANTILICFNIVYYCTGFALRTAALRAPHPLLGEPKENGAWCNPNFLVLSGYKHTNTHVQEMLFLIR
jgi:hypothetical protein